MRWILASVALLLASAGELAAQGKGIRFWNLTTATISGFQLSPAGKDSWGSRSRSLCTARPKQGAMVPVFPWFSQSWEPSRPLERLREERLQREAAAGPMLHPAPELPDDTLIENVRFVTKIRNGLNAAGMKTIGEVRETSDDRLLSLPDLGRGSIAYLRETLGLPSTDGVRPLGKKPA